MRFKKSILASCVLGAVASTTVAWAGPVLSLDLQVHNSGGPAVPTVPTGNHAVSGVIAGQIIQMDVWGLLLNDAAVAGPAGPYTPAVSGDGVNIAVLRYASLDGATAIVGNYQGSTVNSAQFTTNADPGQSHVSYDGKGGTDWGGAYITTTDETNYVTLNTSGTPVAWGPNLAVFLGTIQYQVGIAPNGGSTVLKALPKISNVNGRGDFLFTLNGVGYSSSTDAAASPAASTSPVWPDTNVYDPANPNNSNASSRPLSSAQHIRPGTGVTLTAGVGPSTDTILLAAAPNGGTQVSEGSGPFDGHLPAGSGAPPTPVPVGTAGQGATVGSLHIVDLVSTGDVYVLTHLVGGKTLADLTHLPSGFTAVDLTSSTFLNANLDWKNLMAAYGNFANVGFKFTGAPGSTANDYFVWDLSADSAAIDQIVAVPEPASLGLMGVGILSLMMRRRRN